MFAIRKHKPTPRELFIRKARKSQAGKDALKRLNDYLNAATPEPVYWLHSLWENQQNAITYRELREAIKNGYLDPDTLREWQEDYAKVVSKRIFPGWYDAIAAGAQNVSADATNFGVLATAQWVADHGAELVTVISDEARQAIQALVGATVNGQYTVDELSRAIRPLVGLTKPQAAANLRYYTKVRDNLLKDNPHMKKATAEKRAQEAAMKYAARQHRYRAQMIAETETAKAYTQGYRGYVAQQVQNGALRPGVMVWDTAQDEAVCPVCGALNGQESDAKFTFRLNGKTYDGPPAHPRCRCAEHFEERGEGTAPGGFTQAPWGASGVPGRPGVSPADPYSMTIQTQQEEIGGDGWREICRETHILRENGVDYEVTIISENYNGTLAFRNRVDVKLAGMPDKLALSTAFVNHTDELYTYSKKIKPIEGFEDIVVHGDTVGFSFRDANGRDHNVNAVEFSKILLQSGLYHGGNIRLIACEAGKEGALAAQIVADQLGVTVLAPSDVVYIDVEGNLTISSDNGLTNDGEWVTIEPRKPKEVTT